MDLKEKVKNLPCSPGVYLMKDSLDTIIYVGKSKNLKNRVSSYFQSSKNHSPKVIKLIKNLNDFEYITTDTEFEAFLLECNLIRKIKPIYNKLMKNPKGYSYIKIEVSEKYPKIQVSNEFSKDDKNVYFGPYTNRNTVKRALLGIKECCKILCNSNFRNSSSCINYSLGLCIGMCLNGAYERQYLNVIDKIINLLNGTDKRILNEMESKMKNFSEKFDFENAAKYRDYINAVKYLLYKVNVVNFIEENKNIALIDYLDNNSFKFFLIKGNNVLFKEICFINNLNLDDLINFLKEKIILYFNDMCIKNHIEIGKDEVDESQIIYTYLKNKCNNCKYVIISNENLNSLKHNTDLNNLLHKLLAQ